MGRSEKEKKALDTALTYLSYRDRTMQEVERHLNEKGFAREEIAETIEFLQSCNFLNDQDYCERYIRYGQEKGRGPLRIRQELSLKGVEPHMIQRAIEENYDGHLERELALMLAEKFIKQEGDGSALDRGAGERSEDQWSKKEKQLARMARWLASRGFRSDLVYQIIGRYR